MTAPALSPDDRRPAKEHSESELRAVIVSLSSLTVLTAPQQRFLNACRAELKRRVKPPPIPDVSHHSLDHSAHLVPSRLRLLSREHLLKLESELMQQASLNQPDVDFVRNATDVTSVRIELSIRDMLRNSDPSVSSPRSRLEERITMFDDLRAILAAAPQDEQSIMRKVRSNLLATIARNSGSITAHQRAVLAAIESRLTT